MSYKASARIDRRRMARDYVSELDGRTRLESKKGKTLEPSKVCGTIVQRVIWAAIEDEIKIRGA